MSKAREIEMYVNYADHTWTTEMVEIPANTPEKDIEQTAVNMMIRKLSAPDRDIVAFVGVYHIPGIE